MRVSMVVLLGCLFPYLQGNAKPHHRTQSKSHQVGTAVPPRHTSSQKFSPAILPVLQVPRSGFERKLLKKLAVNHTSLKFFLERCNARERQEIDQCFKSNKHVLINPLACFAPAKEKVNHCYLIIFENIPERAACKTLRGYTRRACTLRFDMREAHRNPRYKRLLKRFSTACPEGGLVANVRCERYLKGLQKRLN